MRTELNHKIISAGFLLLFTAFIAVSCTSSITPVNAGKDGIAIKGYDTVAYFTMGKPVKGKSEFAYDWKGAKWLFSSRQHLDLFSVDPKKYAPMYGGY